MYKTTYDTRPEANATVDRAKRYRQILICLAGNENMTAKEISVEIHRMGYVPTSERNFTATRLTELVEQGRVEVVGKRKCRYTGKTVSVYRAVEQ